MPWSGASGQTYDLTLLDTNALSEIVKRPEQERLGFLKFLGSRSIAPCFTPYNLAELYQAPEVLERFLDLFSEIPVFMTYPWEMVLDREMQLLDGGEPVNPLLNAFTPNGPDPSYDLRGTVESALDDPETRRAIAAGDYHAAAMHILGSWLEQKDNFEPTRPVPNADDARRYVEEAGFHTLCGLRPEWVQSKLDDGVVPSAHDLPSLATMLYSQYWRFWDPSWEPAAGEVRDIQIMAVAPHMDVVVTEKRQAEIFRKTRKAVLGLDDLEVLRLRDLRGGEV